MLTIETSKIKEIIQQQRNFFQAGQTKDINFRLEQLKKLRKLVTDNETAITKALKADLNKSEYEAYFAEVGVIKEIDYAIKNLKNWSKPKKADVPLDFFSYSARIYPEPLGVVLIICPWNYPFALTISPLVGAIAAGNCAIIKPSELAPHTSNLAAQLISKCFPSEYVAVVEGGAETSQELLAEKFDHIFFTGGTAIGKIVMEAAAKHLTPVTLELGGKSPCIVDSNIHLEYTAKRIAWGKFINAGQTCIAPDYLLVNQKIKKDLIAAIQKNLQEFYGDNPIDSPDYGRIISHRHFERLAKFLKNGQVIVGGETNYEDKYIAPTLLDNVSLADPVMQEEIFGPILPMIEYTDIKDAIALINSQPKPLALYIFSQNKALQQQVLQETSSGGVCINDTIMHVGVSSLPFGGVGDSGIGSYHGKASFDTFSHYKSVLKNAFWLDLDWRYAPYKNKLSLLKRMMK
ncbi:aldehyde dehydrogenase family protein [Anabaena sp. FACHB-709]|uniref:Aldehyde dehydrogenase n=2 Tax=Nostocaceae TaxID=1162 RepID=A0A1Z4KJZ7_ANAVA|nr:MULTISPECIES: aldehyde dehydrogenase family protein [Nostocaceae]BAY69299.1 aldehyde dehydrogenase [Trichormus variabilis NIES-23]HBW30748.1 aldehyde dehydrogenase family protein [Nostoc sp. UBA8866]MBD2174679.1 aldehyde dehydrogenase family protein [Anabaena cylindrica FACHB-318]MBD2266440.1 aldehyde dehydrogenase family protein [Anabaena sp. FACHB-709]MBD2275852.1 aldehyde dehydrogenase family protein [Nostoc sp. PCC 7120 = FACHB-418]